MEGHLSFESVGWDAGAQPFEAAAEAWVWTYRLQFCYSFATVLLLCCYRKIWLPNFEFSSGNLCMVGSGSKEFLHGQMQS